MKHLTALTLLLTLPSLGHAAPTHHAGVKKPVHHEVSRTPKPPAPVSTPPLGDRPFPDVPADHWAASAVETLRRRGIVVGYPAAGPSTGP